MGWFSKSDTENKINWIDLDSLEKLDAIIKDSNRKPVVLFKHSTRCSISSMAKSRLEREWDIKDEVDIYYLDLIRFRDISNEIAIRLEVEHQSPQLIMVKNEEVVYHASHNNINANSVKENC